MQGMSATSAMDAGMRILGCFSTQYHLILFFTFSVLAICVVSGWAVFRNRCVPEKNRVPFHAETGTTGCATKTAPPDKSAQEHEHAVNSPLLPGTPDSCPISGGRDEANCAYCSTPSEGVPDRDVPTSSSLVHIQESLVLSPERSSAVASKIDTAASSSGLLTDDAIKSDKTTSNGGSNTSSSSSHVDTASTDLNTRDFGSVESNTLRTLHHSLSKETDRTSGELPHKFQDDDHKIAVADHPRSCQGELRANNDTKLLPHAGECGVNNFSSVDLVTYKTLHHESYSEELRAHERTEGPNSTRPCSSTASFFSAIEATSKNRKHGRIDTTARRLKSFSTEPCQNNFMTSLKGPRDIAPSAESSSEITEDKNSPNVSRSSNKVRRGLSCNVKTTSKYSNDSIVFGSSRTSSMVKGDELFCGMWRNCAMGVNRTWWSRMKAKILKPLRGFRLNKFPSAEKAYLRHFNIHNTEKD